MHNFWEISKNPKCCKILLTFCQQFQLMSAVCSTKQQANVALHQQSTHQASQSKLLSYYKDYEINSNGVKKVGAKLLYITIMHLTTLTPMPWIGNLEQTHVSSQVMQSERERGKLRQNPHLVWSELPLAKGMQAKCGVWTMSTLSSLIHEIHVQWLDGKSEWDKKQVSADHTMHKGNVWLTCFVGKKGHQDQRTEGNHHSQGADRSMKDVVLQIYDELKKAADKKTKRETRTWRRRMLKPLCPKWLVV